MPTRNSVLRTAIRRFAYYTQIHWSFQQVPTKSNPSTPRCPKSSPRFTNLRNIRNFRQPAENLDTFLLKTVLTSAKAAVRQASSVKPDGVLLGITPKRGFFTYGMMSSHIWPGYLISSFRNVTTSREKHSILRASLLKQTKNRATIFNEGWQMGGSLKNPLFGVMPKRTPSGLTLDACRTAVLCRQRLREDSSRMGVQLLVRKIETTSTLSL